MTTEAEKALVIWRKFIKDHNPYDHLDFELMSVSETIIAALQAQHKPENRHEAVELLKRAKLQVEYAHEGCMYIRDVTPDLNGRLLTAKDLIDKAIKIVGG